MKIVVVGVPRKELEEALDKAVLYGMSGAKIKEPHPYIPSPEILKNFIEMRGSKRNDIRNRRN